ncbi:MAG TPA: methionine--tRNA ligase [Bryobacteraceae bacterium]|nr:methionine--tRNA ligase [Bryobacteraceae bacterium]
MKYYLTTPIYYVNAAPHLGTAYCTFTADLIKRFKIMQGFDPVVLTTGSDEHSRNVEKAAAAAGKAPEEYARVIAEEFQRQWKQLDIGIDHFIRTSDPRHQTVVRDLFLRCQRNGYIEKGSYTGQYCPNDEAYVNDAQPGDPCPDCGRPTETVTEDNYFFKLSTLQDRLLELYEKQPEFVQPDYRRNEIVSFVKQGLHDLSITRTNLKWGIPAPVEGNHVFYVWFDALISYMTAVEGEGLWPADLHLIGKDILRFHAVYWPAFLMAAELPLPKKVFAHGWILNDGVKMSKSRGNIVRPGPLVDLIGADGLRYFLWREMTFGQDGTFSYDALIQRYNADLANGLGNLASRTLSMIQQYRNGAVPGADGAGHVAEASTHMCATALEAFEQLNFSRGLEAIWAFISVLDRFIVERAPWKLNKIPDQAEQTMLDETLYTAAEGLRVVTALLYPVMPGATDNIWKQLGFLTPISAVRLPELHWGKLAAGQKIGQPSPVFPRLEAAPLIEKLEDLEVIEKARQAVLMGKTPEPEAAAAESGTPIAAIAPEIVIDDFVKVDLRVGKVLSAEKVKGADKLLHLKVDIGEPQPRGIVAGIAAAYQPDALVGRKVVIVANLAPRKLRGLTSEGMIVAASLEGGSPVLASFLEDVPIGARLK